MTASDTGTLHPIFHMLNKLNSMAMIFVVFLLMSFGTIYALFDLKSGDMVNFAFKFGLLMSVVVLLITQANWYNSHYPRKEKTRVLDDYRVDVNDTIETEVEAPLLSYAQILIRNTKVMLLYLPFYGIGMLTSVYYRELTRAIYLTIGDRSITKIAASLVIFFALFMIGGGLTFVMAVVSPKSENEEKVSIFTILGSLITHGGLLLLIGGIMMVVVALVPAGLAMLLVELGAPPILAILVMGIMPLLNLGIMWMLYQRWLKRRMDVALEELETTIVEEEGMDSEAYQEVQKMRAVEGKSMESRMGALIMPLIFGVVFLLVVAMFIVRVLLPDVDEETMEGVMAIVILVFGVGGMFAGINLIGWYVNKQVMAEMGPVLAEMEAAIARADWKTAVPMAEDFYTAQPTMIRMMGAVPVFLLAGKLDRAEALVRESLAMNIPEDKSKESDFSDLAATHLKMLGDIQAVDGRYKDAQKTFWQGLELKPKSGELYQSLAELEMYRRGDAQQALDYLETALRYRKMNNNPPVELDILMLRAWIMAKLGHHADAEALMHEAKALLDQDNMLFMAAFHLYAGFIARATNKHTLAQVAFNRVFKYDAEGLPARLAREALQTV